MATYFPKKYWADREKIDNHLQRIVDILGPQTVIDNINTMFDIDTAAWFVEQLERDYDLEEEEEDEE